jgi:hypothetical protein
MDYRFDFLIFGHLKPSGCVHPAMLVHNLTRRLQPCCFKTDRN